MGLVDRFAACFTDGRASHLVEHGVRTLVLRKAIDSDSFPGTAGAPPTCACSTREENVGGAPVRRIARHAFDGAVSPLNIKSPPKDASNRIRSVSTTQISLPGSRPGQRAESPTVFKRLYLSSVDSAWNGVSCMGQELSRRPGHPSGHDRERGPEFGAVFGGELALEAG